MHYMVPFRKSSNKHLKGIYFTSRYHTAHFLHQVTPGAHGKFNRGRSHVGRGTDVNIKDKFGVSERTTSESRVVLLFSEC